MRQRLNEIARMQKLAGILKEDEEDSGWEHLDNIEYKEGAGASEKEIQDAIDFYKSHEFGWKYGAKKDFERLAQGGMADIKADTYPTWKKEDFTTVLNAMNNNEIN
jgi:hypothetical protein